MVEQPTIDQRSALIVIDMQNDFLPGGALPVPEGDAIIDGINQLSTRFTGAGGRVVYTQDWHPPGHRSFASAYPGKKPGDPIDLPGLGPVLWPDHCVQNTKGAEFASRMQSEQAICILRKGYHRQIDSYSAFYENDRRTRTGLRGLLGELEVKNVYICGLALDYCCFFSAMDAIRDKFAVFFLQDLTRGIDLPEGNIHKALDILQKEGVIILPAADLA
jgi:nicotinamidase/pyrazinamidase